MNCISNTKKKETGFSVDAPRREHDRTVWFHENTEAMVEFASDNSSTKVELKFYAPVNLNFAKRFRYDALQTSIGYSAEAT